MGADAIRFGILAFLGLTGGALAQPAPAPTFRDGGPGAASAGAAEPPRLPTTSPSATGAPQPVALSASLSGETRPIRAAITWRIYEDRPGTPQLVTKLASATPTVSLGPGTYVVHAAYGLASATKRIAVTTFPVTERLVVDAGALRLGGAIGDVPIPANRLSFAIFQPLPNDTEGRQIAANVKAGEIVRLPTGTYHVVSTYGDSNAIMRTDLKVEAGKVTDATLNHRAATVTLKLVEQGGGEAFAGTAFSVLTPGGDVVREAIGAFPTVTLAEGDYVLIARHNGRVYTRDFKVESGLNRDIEVTATPG